MDRHSSLRKLVRAIPRALAIVLRSSRAVAEADVGARSAFELLAVAGQGSSTAASLSRKFARLSTLAVAEVGNREWTRAWRPG